MKRLIVFGLVLALGACAEGRFDQSINGVTQSEVDIQNGICNRQEAEDNIQGHPHRLVRWAECKMTRIMPLEKKIYPLREKQIQIMYEELLSGLRSVERQQPISQAALNSVYEKWDQREAENRMHQCLTWHIDLTGESVCVDGR